MGFLSYFCEVLPQSKNKFKTMLERALGRKPTAREYIRFFCGFIKDYFIYGSSITDFFQLEFYNKKHKEKKAYYTYRFAKKFDYALDSRESLQYFNSKIAEYKELKKYFKREQLISDECTFDQFQEFVERHPVFFIKPDQMWSGSGIERIDTSKKDIRILFSDISKKRAVIDEPVQQHHLMEELCPGCVNTIRIITAKVENEIFIIGTALRTGDGKSTVDNYHNGGFGAAIDKETGIVIDDAINYTNKRFAEHPASHIRFQGFRIPLWSQVLSLVNDASRDYGLHYCGWDVAVRENDCVLIEVNARPMTRLIQVAGNGGKKAVYRQIYNKWKKKNRSFIRIK